MTGSPLCREIGLEGHDVGAVLLVLGGEPPRQHSANRAATTAPPAQIAIQEKLVARKQSSLNQRGRPRIVFDADKNKLNPSGEPILTVIFPSNAFGRQNAVIHFPKSHNSGLVTKSSYYE